MGRKLLLINPRSSRRSGLNLHNGGYFQPLSLATVAGAVPEDWDVIIEDENWKPVTLRTDVDFVGITAFTSSAPRAYYLASKYRSFGIKVILGGVHATTNIVEASKYADSIILRESDEILPLVIKDFENDQLKAIYDGGYATKFAKPRRDILDPRYKYGSIQTTRGCPLNCDFCSVPLFSGHQARRQDIDNIVEEVYSINNKSIFFVDDNIIGYSEHDRQNAINIFSALSGFNKRWMCQCSINITKHSDILKMMYAAGCKMIMIGIEASDAAGLASLNKNLNKKYEYDFDKIHEAGISVMGFFILGLETDTAETMKNRISTIHECGVDAWQVTVLTPLPGTILFDRLRSANKLWYSDFPHDWGYYDFVGPTFLPDAFPSIIEYNDCLRSCIELAYSESAMEMVSGRNRGKISIDASVMAAAANIKYRRIAMARLHEDESELHPEETDIICGK